MAIYHFFRTRVLETRVPWYFFFFFWDYWQINIKKKNSKVLELTKLEYPKKWYFPTYFANSVSGPNIFKIHANGPFWPHIDRFSVGIGLRLGPKFWSIICLIALKIKNKVFWQKKISKPLRVSNYSLRRMQSPVLHELVYYREKFYEVALKCWQEILNSGSHKYHEILGTTKPIP